MERKTTNSNPIERLLSAIGLATRRTTEARLTEIEQAAQRRYEAGYVEGYYDGNDEPPSGELKSFGYQRATRHGLRDFTKLSHDQIIDIVWTLYQSNPLARRYLQIKRDYILGRDATYHTEDEALESVIAEFWRVNKMGQRLKKFVLQIHLWGEQCYPVYVRQADGQVRLGYIDPSEIEKVITHPHNSMEPWAVVLKTAAGAKARCYRIIREDEGFVMNRQEGQVVVAPKYPNKLVTAAQLGTSLEPWEQSYLIEKGLSQYTGSCFYFSINNVSNQPRGFSDLLQVADFLDAHDETLFALAERESFANYFSWDVELVDQQPEQVTTRRKQIQANPPVKKGQVNVHNSSEVWKMNVPDLKQYATIATNKALENHVLGGFGMPSHWYSHGDDTNRATAVAQNDPTNKTMEHDQDQARDMIEEMLRFARDQAEMAGYWRMTNEDAACVEAVLPEIARKELAPFINALPSFVQALLVAKDNLEVITRETAAQAVGKFLAELGVDYDPSAEIAEIDEQASEIEDSAAQAANDEFAAMVKQADAMLAAEKAKQGMNGYSNGTSNSQMGV